MNCLVRSTDFTYAHELNPMDARNPAYSFLRSVSQTGYERDTATSYRSRSLPPLEFVYTLPEVDDAVREVDAASLENVPYGIDGEIDLEGDGLAGILTEQADGRFYKRSLSQLQHGLSASLLLQQQFPASAGPLLYGMPQSPLLRRMEWFFPRYA